MLTTKATLCFLLLTLSIINMSLETALPTTTKAASTPPGFIDPYAHHKRECKHHKDCNCGMGIGICYDGWCSCVWGRAESPATLEAEKRNTIKQHPSDHTESANTNV